MNIPRLRESTLKREINDNLCKIYIDESEFYLWQKRGDKRIKKECKIVDINTAKSRMVIVTKDGLGHFQDFDCTSDFFFKGDCEDILFKLDPKSVELDKTTIKINLPKSIHLIEKRSLNRIKFRREEMAQLNVSKIVEDSSTKKYFTLELLDISKSGCSIKFTSSNKHFFKKGTVLEIKKILGDDCPGDFQCEIVYRKKSSRIVDGQVERYYQAGVKFLRPINLEDFGLEES